MSISGKSFHRNYRGFCIGPGGPKCPCCNPTKKLAKRHLYRRGLKEFNKIVERIENVESQDE